MGRIAKVLKNYAHVEKINKTFGDHEFPALSVFKK